MKKLKVIYEPKGKAKEYADLALNLYTGCDNGCEYCYGPAIMHTDKKDFHASVNVRKDIINKVKHDAKILEGDSREIFLCFTCDPYAPGTDPYSTTTEALEILLNTGLNINILSKGGYRTLRDFDLLVEHKDQVKMGASLVFINDEEMIGYERYAAPTSERCHALYKYRKAGVRTWASLEPVWSAYDACKIIDGTKDYIDMYKIGKLNYHPHANDVDWYKTITEIVNTCEKHEVNYMLKKETIQYANI